MSENKDYMFPFTYTFERKITADKTTPSQEKIIL